jgi:hypothetical protein
MLSLNPHPLKAEGAALKNEVRVARIGYTVSVMMRDRVNRGRRDSLTGCGVGGYDGPGVTSRRTEGERWRRRVD